MIGLAQDGGALMHDAALDWNSAVADYRISPNRNTAQMLFDAAGEWALDIGPLTDTMQAMLDESAALRGVPAVAAPRVPWGLILAGVGAYVLLSGPSRRPRRRR